MEQQELHQKQLQQKEQEDEIRRVFCRFLECIMIEKDIKQALRFVTPHVMAVGMSAADIVRSRAELGSALHESVKALDDASYALVFDSLNVSASQKTASVGASLRLRRTSGTEMSEIAFTQTASMSKRASQWRITLLHASPFVPTDESESAYPLQFAKAPQRIQARMQEKAFELIGKSLPGGMASWYIEEDFPIYFINTGMLQYLGYTREDFFEFSEGSALYFVHPKDREMVEQAVMEAVEQGGEYCLRHRLRRHDMSEVWVTANGRVGKTRDGRDVMINVYVDITQSVVLGQRLEKADSELEAKNRELAIISAAVPASICTLRLDDSLRLLYANQRFYKRYGYTPQQMRTELDNSWTGLLEPEAAQDALRIINGAESSGGESFEFATQILCRDKSKTDVRVSGSFMRTSSGVNVYCVMFDE